MNTKYQKRYTLKGESPLVRVNFLIPKEQYRKLQKIKKDEGIPINFFIQKAIERILKEKGK